MTHDQETVTRRRFVQTTAASSLALAGVGFGRPGFAQAAKPNIVFILADDLGYADVSCYGRREYTTPNIDRLASEGLKFMQAYSNSANCTPTRVGLATGRYQMRLEAGLEEPINAGTPKGIGLPPSHPTLSSLLKKAGYGTSLVGKWHLGYLPDFSPLKSGYDRFFGIFAGSADYFDHGSKSPAPLYEQEVPVDRIGYMTNLLGDRAIQTIEGYANSKEPFLLSLHFTAPHSPWLGPDDEAESQRIRAQPGSPTSPGQQSPSIQHRDGGSLKVYASMVQSMDANIGRVLQALDARGLSQNTIVVFTSDNGGERFSDMWPFSGMKGELLEGGLRIPAIARWPGHVTAGAVSEQVMVSMDWLPTLLAAAGTVPDPTYPPDGENLLPNLTGRAPPHPRKLYWRFRAGGQRALREGDWKYLKLANNEFLFDVVKDPRERANLKDRHKDVFEHLKSDWVVWSNTMLPERPRPAGYSQPGNLLPQHIGRTNPAPVDPPGSPAQR